jgi:probable phosphoglycerate mutase
MSANEHAVKAEVTIILVRHGYVEGIDPARFRGRRDLPLTPLGLRQAKALSRRIAAEWQPEAIFASPLGRCIDTAKAVAKPVGLVPEPVPGLNDIDYGAWQGMTHAEVHANWPDVWTRWHDTPQLAEFPGGESLPEFSRRVVNALHRSVHDHRGHTVVIVAHDSVNRVLLLHALGLPLSRYHAITQAPCGLNVLEFEHGQLKVVTINETGHLLGL